MKKVAHLLSRNILSTAAVVTLMGVAAFAAAPTGGYAPGETLNPQCAPGEADCFVKISTGKFVDGTDSADAVFTGGNVGIGTANPTSIIEAIGTTYGADVLRVTREGTDDFVSITPNSLKFNGMTGGGFIQNLEIGSPIRFYTSKTSSNDTAAMLIRSDGNVGIGTVNPSKKFQVEDGDVYFKGGELLVAPTGNGNGNFTVNGSGAVIVGNSSNNDYKLSVSGTHTHGYKGLFVQGQVKFGFTYVPRGLELYSGQATGWRSILSFTGNGSDPDLLKGQIGNIATNQDFYIKNYQNSNIILSASNGNNFLKLDNNGNVGIGNSSPVSKLAVSGLPSGTTDAVADGNLAGAVCITDTGNMYIDTDGSCAN